MGDITIAQQAHHHLLVAQTKRCPHLLKQTTLRLFKHPIIVTPNPANNLPPQLDLKRKDKQPLMNLNPKNHNS